MAKTAVTTRSFDNTRRNVNLNEARLTPTLLRQRGIRYVRSLSMPDDARGSEGMPLIVPDLQVAGRARDVVFACSMANNVYAWDAGDGTELWRTNLGNPVQGSKSIDQYTVNDHWGVLSTPVIDLESASLYCVAWTSPNGTAGAASFHFHALRLTDGAVTASVGLDRVSYQAGPGLPLQRFQAAERKQRCALTLTHIGGVKTVFVAAGSVSETLASNRGWVIAFDVTDSQNPQFTAAWSSTVSGAGAGIWMAGQGPAAIDNKLYLMTGNGDFDGVTEFGECLLELTYTSPTATQSARLRVTDHFSPFSDSGRDGQNPTNVSIGRPGVDRPSNTNQWEDMDLGSGGIVVVPELGLALGAGKDGIAYVLRLGRFGKTRPGDFATANIAKNYAHCASTPLWFTYYNPSVSPTPTDLTALNKLFDGFTHHQHSTPIVYRSHGHGWMVFTWGENGNLRAWRLMPNGTLTFLASGAEVASPNTAPPGGMPGGMITLSANGSTLGTAIVWACVPYGDANKTVTNGRLIAYDAENFGTFPNGEARIMPVWDSEQWNIHFMHNKFNIPVAANGRVYVPTYNATIDVYE